MFIMNAARAHGEARPACEGEVTMSSNGPITPDEVRRRAALAGVTIDDELVGEVAAAMELTIAALRGLAGRDLRLVEPAATFDARWGDGEGSL
jgi:hypothetical protein